MLSAEGFRPTLETLAGVLERLGIRYHLTGGIVSVVYGEPRLTQDVDVVLDPDQVASCVGELLRHLTSVGLHFDEGTARDAIERGGMFQVLDIERVVKLDLYVRCLVPGELDRSVPGQLFEGRAFPIVSRADAAVSKLLWANYGSHRSRRDLRRLLEGASAGEREWVQRTAESMGVLSLLEEILGEPDEIDA